jgi:uncharacterized protein (UPF0332 family)
MATWRSLSKDSWQSAKLLLKEKHARSAISRAYYSAYSAVANVMVERGVVFPHDWNNPGHDQLIPWVSGQRNWSRKRRRILLKSLRRIRKAREDADYRPGLSIDIEEAIQSLKDARVIRNAVETDDEANRKK